MKNNLTATNQNAKLALSKSKSLLNITNGLLSKKANETLVKSFQFKPYLSDTQTCCINALALTPNGKTIISGSDNNTIKIWDMENGECMGTFKGHSSSISSLAISPDGKKIVSGSFDKTIKIWDMQSGQCLDTLEGHSYDVGSLAISLDGKTIVSGGSWDNTIKIWDMQSGQCLDTFPSILDALDGHGHTGKVNSVAIIPDGKTIVSGGGDNTIKIWNMQNGESLNTLKGYSDSVLSVAITPDRKMIVSGGGRTVKVISSDRKTIVSGSNDSSIKLWDIESGKCLDTFEGHSNSINSLAISPDGKKIVSGSDDNTIKIWDIQSGESLHNLKGHSSGINSVAISPDGKMIVSGSHDGTIKLWDIQNGECTYTSYNMKDDSTITIFSDGSFNASEENIDKFIRIDDTSTSCRKLTKEEIEHFCKVKYENKNKIPEIDIDENEIPF